MTAVQLQQTMTGQPMTYQQKYNLANMLQTEIYRQEQLKKQRNDLLIRLAALDRAEAENEQELNRLYDILENNYSL